MSKDKIESIIVELGGNKNDVVAVVIEKDAGGRVTQVVVVTAGDEAAQTIATIIQDEVSKGDDCRAGVLCKATDVFSQEKSKGSGVPRLMSRAHLLLLCSACVLLTKHRP